MLPTLGTQKLLQRVWFAVGFLTLTHLPTPPVLFLLAGLSAYWYAALSGSAPVASHHQLSGRTVSNNIFLDTIFGDCMPRITCHKLGAGESCSNNCLAVAACKMLAPTAYREWCSGRHLSDLASQSCGRVAVVAPRIWLSLFVLVE